MNEPKATQPPPPGDHRKSLERLLREFHTACRIFSLYPLGHSASEEAVESPYRSFREIFEFKKSVYLEGAGNYLVIEDVCLRSGDLVGDVLSDLDLYGVNSILFRDTLTRQDLYHLFSFLSSKKGHGAGDLQSHLKACGVSSIEVNTAVFSHITQSGGDLSVLTQRVRDLLKKDPARLARFLSTEEGLDEKATSQVLGFEIHSEVARKLIAEDVKKYSAAESAEILKDLLPNLELSGLPAERRGSVLHEIITTFSCGHDQTELLRPLLADFLQAGWSKEEIKDALKPEATHRWTLLDRFEQIIGTLNNIEQKPPSSEEFRSVVEGFSSAQDWQKLSELLEQLSKILQRGTAEQKRRVSLYLGGMLDVVSQKSPERFLKSLIRHSQDLYLKAPSKDSELLLLQLARELILIDDFQLAKELLSVLDREVTGRDLEALADDQGRARRGTEDKQLVEKLISQIRSGEHQGAMSAVDLILTLGNDKAFKRLTDIFTDPDKSVRLASLKALRSGGEAAFNACDSLLGSEELRGSCSKEGPLPDQQWYKIRNAIFVIGELRYPRGINSLLKWSKCGDPRVRYEVTTAAEKIGDEQAAKLLLILADDKDPKVRNRAIVGLGQVGTATEVAALIGLSQGHPDSLPAVVKTLARLGGTNSRDFLFTILEEDRFLKERGVSKKEIQELRILALKAIAQIGDELCLSKLREYRERKGGSARILKKKDNLQATAVSLLEQIEQRKPQTAPEPVHQV